MGTDQTYHQAGVLRVLQSKEETKAFYNKIAGVYDMLAERSERPVREAGLKMLGVRSGERMLEIGFGTGHCLVELARAVGPSGRVFGIDLSDNMVRAAEKLVRDEGLEERTELVCGDALHLPYEAESVDGIFMSFTLELFDTPEILKVLAECRRVLKTGGRIVVVGMSRTSRGGLVTEVFEWTHRHFPNYLDCRPILVRRALEDAGLRITGYEIAKMWVNVEVVRGVK
jgi:ubiquinone/menaquinone biosynthesis C-methylase UbiE